MIVEWALTVDDPRRRRGGVGPHDVLDPGVVVPDHDLVLVRWEQADRPPPHDRRVPGKVLGVCDEQD